MIQHQKEASCVCTIITLSCSLFHKAGWNGVQMQKLTSDPQTFEWFWRFQKEKAFKKSHKVKKNDLFSPSPSCVSVPSTNTLSSRIRTLPPSESISRRSNDIQRSPGSRRRSEAFFLFLFFSWIINLGAGCGMKNEDAKNGRNVGPLGGECSPGESRGVSAGRCNLKEIWIYRSVFWR